MSDGEDLDTTELSRTFRSPYPLRWLFHHQNLGLPSSRNTGAAAANGEVILFLDDDVLAADDLVHLHLKHHTVGCSSRTSAVCGRIVEDREVPLRSFTDSFLQQSWDQGRENFQNRIACNDARSVGGDYERAVYVGLNCSMRREAFLDSGGFDPKLRSLDEEVELGHRLYRTGVQFTYEPLAVARHRNRKDLVDYFRRCWWLEGQTDTRRVFDLGQRNAQTLRLVSIYGGSFYDKNMARASWYGNRAVGIVANVIERATNRTGSRLLFGAWMRTCRPSAYWKGVKAEGCTLARLKEAAGSPACALAFHNICVPELPEDVQYHISPARFSRYIRLLLAASYKPASLSDWLRGDVSSARVLLTFDDGYEELAANLLPSVIRFGLKPIVFLVAGRIGATNVWDHVPGRRPRKLLNLDQIREMQKHGVDFASHTLTHPWLPTTSDRELRAEVSDSKRMLEDVLGKEVTCFAYPFGGVDQRVRAAVAQAGYKLAFTTNPGLNWWQDPLCLNRAEVGEQDAFLDLMMKVRTGYGLRQWLGHRWKSGHAGLRTIWNAAGHLGRDVDSLRQQISRGPRSTSTRPYTH